jgi:hypothetical protein
MARIQAGWIERERAPLVTRDAILALLEETRASARASAKREISILVVAVGSFLATLALLLLEVL